MKTTHILRALVLLTLFRPDTTFAATAPSTLADMVYYDSGGIAALRVGGSRWIALQPDGTYVFLMWYPTQLVGGSSVLAGLAAPPRNGRYTYTKLGNTTGRLQLISDTGNSTSTIELDFTADDSGFAQYSASTGSELAPGAGFLAAFRISPLANRKLAPLVNVSLRGNVARGRPLIAGFVVPAGTTAATLLIRVVGPSLAQFGVAGVWNDPEFRLHRSGGAEIDHGSWYYPDNPTDSRGASALQRVTDYLGAFPLVPGSRDAIGVITLPRGVSYTVVCEAPEGSGGEALIEIYALPP